MKEGAGSMMKYLPQADLEKLKTVLAIKNAYNAGEVSLADAQKELKAKVGTLKPYEIALAEQELKEVEDDECRKEDIQKMLELFDGILDTGRPDLPKDHPIMCYYREDDELRKILDAIEDLVQYPMIKNQWLEIYDKLGQYRLHLSRKQNQLYPVLEKKGFDRPTTTMWLLDDFIRDEIKEARGLLDADKEDEFLAMQKTVVDDVRDLMTKEETVLYPTSLAMISPDEFEHMKSGDREIGFAWIGTDEAKAPASAPAAPKAAPAGTPGFGAELAALLGKYGYGGSLGKLLDVTTGQLTLDQINLIYQHMPVDLSFVDENEKVCFYTDTKHRVFPRSKNVIGRDVKNCHPRTSVHIVEEIIEKFRSGEQDKAEFWINKPGLFIYILYVAVRDEQGNFKGVLEMIQDCTHIRSLEGSRTLLTWDKDNGGEAAEEAPAEKPEETAPAEAPKGDLAITGDTFVKDILAAYPFMRDKMGEINGKFKLLKTPLARVMLPKATVQMMSERSGMPLGALIKAIKEKIGEGE